MAATLKKIHLLEDCNLAHTVMGIQLESEKLIKVIRAEQSCHEGIQSFYCICKLANTPTPAHKP